jgi:hypothetical protein
LLSHIRYPLLEVSGVRCQGGSKRTAHETAASLLVPLTPETQEGVTIHD